MAILKIGRTIKNRYRVDEYLGGGGMAEVYQVFDKKRATHLAMKVLRQDIAQDPIFLRRFQREAKTLAALKHPNIVHFYGLERDDLMAFLLMEYIDGVSLQAEILRANGKSLSNTRILEVLEAVCAALHYAHGEVLVHCDIKPGNILIEKNGRILLTDFGIARSMDTATSTMVGIGTPAYMSPELVKEQNPSPQSDIYSLGILLHEMLTGGERPFTGDKATITGSTAKKVRWEQVRLEPEPPSTYNKKISNEMDAVVMRCLKKEPSQRYASSSAFLEHLKHPDSAPPARTAKRSAKPETPQVESQTNETPAWQRWYTWAGAGLLTAAIVAAGFLIFEGDGEPGAETAQAVAAPAVQGEMADTPQPTATFVPTPTRDYRKNPNPITPENIERLALNTSIPYPDEIKDHRFLNRPRKAPVSNELIGSVWDSSSGNWKKKYFRINIDPDAEFEILDGPDVASFSPYEEYLIYRYTTFSADQKVIAEEVYGKVDVRTYPGDEPLMSTATLFSNITSIALSPDGHYLAVGREDGRVLMWDVQKDEYLDLEMYHKISTISGHVYTLAFSPDGRYLVSGGDDAVINIWEVPTGKKVDSINKHVEDIEELMFSQYGQYLISTGNDARIFIWDFQSFELVSQCEVFSKPDRDWRTFSQQFNQNHTKNILLFMGYKNFVDLSGNNNEKFILVEIPTCRVLYDFDAAENEKAFFSEDDRFLVITNEDGIDLYSVVED